MILIFGGTGLVGSALIRHLKKSHIDWVAPTRKECELLDITQIRRSIDRYKPSVVIHCAGRVGGILANSREMDRFTFENTVMGMNVTSVVAESDLETYVYLGSNCIYPNDRDEPLKATDLLSGTLEPTNRGYALAKLTTIEMIRSVNDRYGLTHFCVMPCNIFGYGDNFDLERAHVLQSLMVKAHKVKQEGGPFTIWGDGQALREYLWSDDLASAVMQLIYSQQQLRIEYTRFPIINVSSGEEKTIIDIAKLVCDIVGIPFSPVFDESKPSGTRRKALSCPELRQLGWVPAVSLRKGIENLYRYYEQSIS